jgi:hypothetical protein
VHTLGGDAPSPQHPVASIPVPVGLGGDAVVQSVDPRLELLGVDLLVGEIPRDPGKGTGRRIESRILVARANSVAPRARWLSAGRPARGPASWPTQDLAWGCPGSSRLGKSRDRLRRPSGRSCSCTQG